MQSNSKGATDQPDYLIKSHVLLHDIWGIITIYSVSWGIPYHAMDSEDRLRLICAWLGGGGWCLM